MRTRVAAAAGCVLAAAGAAAGRDGATASCAPSALARATFVFGAFRER